MDAVWLDVAAPMGLTGNFHPLADLECEPPQPVPDTPHGWQRWAAGQLAAVAAQEAWQPGRYAYTVSIRDDGNRSVDVLTHGQWELVR